MGKVQKALSVLVLATVPAVVALFYAAYGSAAARQFRIADFEADFLSGLLAALVVLALIQALPVPRRDRRLLSLLWLARLAACLGVMLYYEASFATLDARAYFRRGVTMGDPLGAFVFGDGTANIEALCGLLAGLTQSYTAMKVIFAAIGLAGVYIGYRAAARALGRDSEALLLFLGLAPSVLFWTSILGKEPVATLGIALFCLGAVGLVTGARERRLADIALVAAGVLVAASIRIWLAPILLAPLAAALVLTGRSPLSVKLAALAVATPLGALGLMGFADQFRIETTQDLLAFTNDVAERFARGGSAQEVDAGFDSLGSLVAYLPFGIFTALFRPLPGEVMTPFGLLAGLENAALLALLAWGVRRRGIRPVLAEPVLAWAVLTLLAWAAVYGFVSASNIGTAFRFRLMVSPILLPLALWYALGPPWHPRRPPPP